MEKIQHRKILNHNFNIRTRPGNKSLSVCLLTVEYKSIPNLILNLNDAVTLHISQYYKYL